MLDQTPAVVVHPMRPEEKPEVRKIFRRSFALVKRWFFFSWTPDVLVAERDGKLLGAVMLETYPLPGDRKGGFVTWVFVAPEARGTGVGQRLIEAALELFESRGCDEVTTFVEGYNTSSSKLFSTRGFSTLSPGQQLRRYGFPRSGAAGATSWTSVTSYGPVPALSDPTAPPCSGGGPCSPISWSHSWCCGGAAASIR